MWVLGLTEDLEARVLKESPGQHTASRRTSLARRATGLAETAGAGRWASSESARRSSKNVPKLEQDVTTVLLYDNRHFDGRRGKNDKIDYCDHPTRNSNAMG